MKVPVLSSGHWTDEQLIASFYGVGPEDGHLAACQECQARVVLLNANRQSIEAARADELAGFEFLAAQRRAIYEKLDKPVPWWFAVSAKRWASVAATALVLIGGVAVYEQQQHAHQITEKQLSDAQLAQEVSTMSQEYEAQPTAPLQGLFE